ncbi:helix-turn-helix domain-containing protein [Rhizobium ruizarguesonis]|uniref:helix-turn-helix domain-containing protein n=1 Tax=Rhizobium ruizarguesonis TaxID=2081791 RepID=UPI0004880AD6|nr:helix-turn-helix domain-containing protein [Rhizobium ruizarguesonis]QJS27450.1 hypothetical protein RLTA1_09200 [Rhizobium leguminosarum bv. trifolii TA1]UFW96203.1 hypothetical protein RlegTA1_09165 [Rhizobium ruizarguesonis]
MIVSAMEFTSAAEMRAHAAAVHARCFNPPVRLVPKLEPIVEEPAIPVFARQLPTWEAIATSFDAHVVQWRNRMGNQPKAYLKDRCRELGIPYAVMVGKDRRRKVSDARHVLVWEIHNKFGMSFPALGRLFGGRDHTTALYSVRKVEAMRGAA